ncbi:MAG: tRNA pseudouridine(13) synthase TruD [Deltaproteobacteria bacterium]|nr:tRNA pseudouridine(13) synthase TruD [Deltaproteobacteria bacterium]
MTHRWFEPIYHLERIPAWTEHLPGTGGHIGGDIEAFQVEEIPAYPAAGRGDHCFVFVEKRAMSTPGAITRLAQALDVPRGAIGYAGLKDTWAVTRQYLSIRDVEPNKAMRVKIKDLTVLSARRHVNKLKMGHMKGNRFAIAIEPEADDALDRAQRILDDVTRRGIANLYGPQRFGVKNRNVIEGIRILKGEVQIKDRRKAKFLLSSVQSMLFNQYMDAAMTSGYLDQIHPGDICRVGHRIFVAGEDELPTDAAPTGPLFGPRMPHPGLDTQARTFEDDVLTRSELDPDLFGSMGRLTRGGRRDALVYPTDVSCHMEGARLIVQFTLPSGSYATVLVHEILKVPFSRIRPRPRSEEDDRPPR